MSKRAHLSLLLTVALAAAAFILMLPSSGLAQCGELDGGGGIDIGDLSPLIDHLFISYDPLINYTNAELDGCDLVTVRDYLMFYDNLFPFPNFPSCGAIYPAFVPSTDSSIYLVINTDAYPAMGLSAFITVDIVTSEPIRLLDLPLGIRVNGAIPFNIEGITGSGAEWIPAEGVVRSFRSGSPAIPAGTTRLFSLNIQANGGIDPLPITYSYISQPPLQEGVRVRSAMAILPLAGYPTYEPLITIASSCCVSMVGNVDCDPLDNVDISDLTVIIDNLFISFLPLCCNDEANCDGDPLNNIDIGDLTALIDNLFVTFTPLPSCQ